LFKNIPLHAQKPKSLWVGRSSWGRRIELELATKIWAHKKTPLTSFSNCLLKNTSIKSMFPYGRHPLRRGKVKHHGVTRVTSVKLPHCTCLALVYPMKNKMPFIHHVIKWWGCYCTIKDGKGLNERTQRHPMMKPMSKLIQAWWEQRRVLSRNDHNDFN
jgi:hypothetical protein